MSILHRPWVEVRDVGEMLTASEGGNTIPQISCSSVFMFQARQEASRCLFDFAEQQQGYFTTKQTKAAGAENTHSEYVVA